MLLSSIPNAGETLALTNHSAEISCLLTPDNSLGSSREHSSPSVDLLPETSTFSEAFSLSYL